MARSPKVDQAKSSARKAMTKIAKYQQVFESDAGKWVLSDMMAAHGMLSAHPADPHKMALKEGERLVCLRILAFLKTNPEQLKERIEDYERSLASTL